MIQLKPMPNASQDIKILGKLDHTMGHIRGKVIDIDGRTVEGAKLWIRETGQNTYSDKNGNFVIINIPPALYTVVVECEGYALSVMPDLPIGIGDNAGFRFVVNPYPIYQQLFKSFVQNEPSYY